MKKISFIGLTLALCVGLSGVAQASPVGTRAYQGASGQAIRLPNGNWVGKAGIAVNVYELLGQEGHKEEAVGYVINHADGAIIEWQWVNLYVNYNYELGVGDSGWKNAGSNPTWSTAWYTCTSGQQTIWRAVAKVRMQTAGGATTNWFTYDTPNFPLPANPYCNSSS